MAAIGRLKKRPDFLAAAEGRRFHTDRMTVQGRRRDGGDPAGLRLGLTVTKRVGHATERNRIKRRLRAAADLVAADLPADLAALPADIVLIARRPVLEAAFPLLAEDLRRALAAVTRPGAPRGGRPAPGRRGDRAQARATPLAGPAFPGATDLTSEGGAPRGGRGLPATPNACAGVPDGQ